VSRFIQDDDGDWVNLDHVASVQRPRQRGGHYTLRSADGKLMGALQDGFDPETLFSPIVPAVAGEALLEIWVSPDGSARPEQGDVFVSEYPIVAWRISQGFHPYPITLSQASESDVFTVIKTSGGRFIRPWLDDYESLDAAKAHALELEQNSWDRKQAAKAA
jgi:hypothetical protein